MIGLIQRVTEASVVIDDATVARIDRGILVLVGIERDDQASHARRLAERLLRYRVFADNENRMNLSVTDIQGGVLLVPQFTLAANTQKGTRASLGSAKAPDEAEKLFSHLCDCVAEQHSPVETGRFGADMEVVLVNHGPVTFWLNA